jgi:F-type H+-transporting ATPase subunit epsilon
MSLAVEIVTPSSIAFSGEVSGVQAPGLLGDFGVMPGHAQMLAVTQPGRVTLQTATGPQMLLVGAGFAEVGAHRVTLLVDLCEPVGAVDRGVVQVELNEAIAALGRMDTESDEGIQTQKRIDLAAARLQE